MTHRACGVSVRIQIAEAFQAEAMAASLCVSKESVTTRRILTEADIADEVGLLRVVSKSSRWSGDAVGIRRSSGPGGVRGRGLTPRVSSREVRARCGERGDGVQDLWKCGRRRVDTGSLLVLIRMCRSGEGSRRGSCFQRQHHGRDYRVRFLSQRGGHDREVAAEKPLFEIRGLYCLKSDRSLPLFALVLIVLLLSLSRGREEHEAEGWGRHTDWSSRSRSHRNPEATLLR
jgi:hypothetical protein